VRGLSAIVAIFLIAFIGGCGDDDEPGPAPDSGEGVAAIVVKTPQPGDTVSSPVTIAGTASVFEGTVQIRILDEDGKEIASSFATASEGAPGRGEFEKGVTFSVPAAQEGTIEAYEADAASGAEGSPSGRRFTVSVPVRLQP
jgi:hypothetical protein